MWCRDTFPQSLPSFLSCTILCLLSAATLQLICLKLIVEMWRQGRSCYLHVTLLLPFAVAGVGLQPWKLRTGRRSCGKVDVEIGGDGVGVRGGGERYGDVAWLLNGADEVLYGGDEVLPCFNVGVLYSDVGVGAVSHVAAVSPPVIAVSVSGPVTAVSVSPPVTPASPPVPSSSPHGEELSSSHHYHSSD